jgi:hypothetical protein
MRWGGPRTAFWLGVAAILAATPAIAADTGNGSKNFNVPSSVPNYFSNEAGPMLGPTAESQRGALYPSRTVAAPAVAAAAVPSRPAVAPVAVAPVASAPVAAAPRPRERQYIAMAEPRGRLIRGRSAPVVAHHAAVRGRPVTRVVAQGSSRVHTAYAVERTVRTTGRANDQRSSRSVSTSTRVNATHRHARG